MSLDEVFSEQNMFAYSQACVNLAIDLAETRYKKGYFNTLVIPSRGSLPFFLGTLYAMDKLRGISSEAARFSENVAVQPILTPLLPETIYPNTNLHDAETRVLLIPFTADLNVKKFDPTLNNDEFVKKTRQYWAGVTASLFKDSRGRSYDPFFRSFTDIILRRIEDRGRIAEMYEAFPRIDSFSIIDTVISGRACNEILKAFSSLAMYSYIEKSGLSESLVPHAFLIIDENGRKLDNNVKYSQYLRERQTISNLYTFLYPIPKIVSEDTNSSLLGVSAKVYPSIMRESQRRVLDRRDMPFFLGAGSWFIDPEGPNRKHFGVFMGLVYAGIDAALADFFYRGEALDIANRERFRQRRLSFIKYAKDQQINRCLDFNLHKDNGKTNSGEIRPYQTHSSVLHVPLDENQTREIINEVCSLPGLHCKSSMD